MIATREGEGGIDRRARGIGADVEVDGQVLLRARTAPELARLLAMHVAFSAPDYLTREEVPAEDVQREREIYEKLPDVVSKPENIRPQIVEGMIGKRFYAESVLLEQAWIHEPSLTVGRALDEQGAELLEYVRELMEYSSLRRRHILESGLEPEGTFTYAFDRIMEREFRVDPAEFRLEGARRMRFWHDEVQARDIADLCAEVGNPVLRARSFIYPQTDPGVNPYLRRSRFC